MTKQNSGNIIDTVTAAKLLGITPRRIRQLSSDGFIESVSRNKWSLVNVVQGYIAFLKSEDRQSSKSEAASRVTDARTREIEIRIAEKERDLMPSSEVSELFDKVTGAFLVLLASLPVQITRPSRERKRIEKIIDDAKQRLSDKFHEAAKNVIQNSPQTKSKTKGLK